MAGAVWAYTITSPLGDAEGLGEATTDEGDAEGAVDERMVKPARFEFQDLLMSRALTTWR
jgi:hypothetical protein